MTFFIDNYAAVGTLLLSALGLIGFIGTYIRSSLREAYEKGMKVVYEEQTFRYFSVGIPVRVSVYEDFLVVKCIHAIKIPFSSIVSVTYRKLYWSSNAHIEYQANQDRVVLFYVFDVGRMMSALSDEKLSLAKRDSS